jgi:adenylate kinase
MLRDNIQCQTELAKKAMPLINRGELVPDDLMLAIVQERIAQPDCQNGFILDGFPRTLRQAHGLEEICCPYRSRATTVLNFVVRPELLVRRLANRRICKMSGHIYNLLDCPPLHPGICDLDGSELLQRSDDTQAVVRERIDTYEHHTRPLIDFYSARGLLFDVEGMCDPDAVTAIISKVLIRKDSTM